MADNEAKSSANPTIPAIAKIAPIFMNRLTRTRKTPYVLDLRLARD